jgi:uncharacterized caspase-like protein
MADGRWQMAGGRRQEELVYYFPFAICHFPFSICHLSFAIRLLNKWQTAKSKINNRKPKTKDQRPKTKDQTFNKTMRFRLSHFVLFIAFFVALGSSQAQSGREAFRLELPELNTGSISLDRSYIARTDANIIKFWIVSPFAQVINWQEVRPTINGKSASRICQQRAGMHEGAEAKLLLCDLSRFPEFKLLPDKNTFEIEAKDKAGNSYYASFVLLKGKVDVAQHDAPTELNIRRIPVSGDESLCPEIILNTPLSELKAGREIRLRGSAKSESDKIASITINGQAAFQTSNKQSKERGLGLDQKGSATNVVQFDRVVSSVGAKAVVIEATDLAGNKTQLTLPLSGKPQETMLGFSGRKFAVIIGVSDYQYNDAGLTDLAFADDDAQALYDFLIQPQGGGFNKENILFLLNEQATLNAVRDSLKRFLTRARKTDMVLFFLAGHGSPDPYDPKNLYFIVHDSKVADLKRTALPMVELKEIIETSLSAQRAVFLLDTCHSAGVSGQKIVGATSASDPNGDKQRGLALDPAEKNVINDFATKQIFKQEGRAVMTSADVNETARESAKWGGGHGVFTWTLLEGLKGEADDNGDKVVTVGELFVYVRSMVRLLTAQKQNPRAMSGLNSGLELAAVP